MFLSYCGSLLHTNSTHLSTHLSLKKDTRKLLKKENEKRNKIKEIKKEDIKKKVKKSLKIWKSYTGCPVMRDTRWSTCRELSWSYLEARKSLSQYNPEIHSIHKGEHCTKALSNSLLLPHFPKDIESAWKGLAWALGWTCGLLRGSIKDLELDRPKL